MTLVLLFAVCLLVSVLVSGIAARTVLSTSLVFLLAGTVIGQGGLGLVQLDANSPIVGTLADLALFTVLFVDGTALRTLTGEGSWNSPPGRWASGCHSRSAGSPCWRTTSPG